MHSCSKNSHKCGGELLSLAVYWQCVRHVQLFPTAKPTPAALCLHPSILLVSSVWRQCLFQSQVARLVFYLTGQKKKGGPTLDATFTLHPYQMIRQQQKEKSVKKNKECHPRPCVPKYASFFVTLPGRRSAIYGCCPCQSGSVESVAGTPAVEFDWHVPI